jgi:oxygen-dependent protoporphyrinogen oxidase
VPTNPIALAATGLLSVKGRCRLLAGLLLSPRAGDTEETIEQVATRRFGRETSDAIVSAAISGIFAGDITKLSLSACFPTVARIDAEARSLLGYGLTAAFRAVGKKKGGHRRRWRGLVSIDGGLGALTHALGRRLGEDLLYGCRAEAIDKIEGGYEVRYGDAGGTANALRCRHLVLGTPAEESGRLLRPLLPDASAILGSIESASLVVLNLGFRSEDVAHSLNGFGFLVPHDEPDFPLMGVLWADSIFPHHAPPNHRLLRVFIGGARKPEVMDQTDDELLRTATGAVRELLQVSGNPVLVDVCRYPAAIPQYHRGYREKVDRLRDTVATLPGMHLVGNYLEGVSLNDCVRVGTQLAGQLIGTGADVADSALRTERQVAGVAS